MTESTLPVGLVPGAPASEAADLAALQAWSRQRFASMTDDLQTFVETETPSTDKVLLDRGLAWIERYLAFSLGAPDQRVIADGGGRGDTLQVEYAGGARTVLVLCHYDTVWDAGTLAQWPCTIEAGVMRGPGVFDMKSGLIQFVWALRALAAVGLPAPTVRLLCTGDEELGSGASRATIEAAAEGVDAVLVMEPGVDGALKTSRKGVGLFTFELTGVEAHTGLDPAKGASAVHELAHLILELRALHDLSVGTSVNFGVVSGGHRANVTAGRARATMDVRVDNPAEARRVEAAVAGVMPVDERVRIDVTGGWNRPVMDRTPQIGALYDVACEIAGHLGITLKEQQAGGGSDGNFLAGRGLPLLDGLGAVGAGAHSRDEHVRLAETWERVALVAGLLARYGKDDA